MYPMRYVSDAPKQLTLNNSCWNINGIIQIGQLEQANRLNIHAYYQGIRCDIYSEINQKVRYVSDFS